MLTELVNEIRWYMREHDLNIEEVAQRMGIAPGRLELLLSGGLNLRVSDLDEIADALGAHGSITLVKK